eukprot:scaffold26835_cov107-Isochrysis_galbana.AAC.2
MALRYGTRDYVRGCKREQEFEGAPRIVVSDVRASAARESNPQSGGEKSAEARAAGIRASWRSWSLSCSTSWSNPPSLDAAVHD